LNCRLELLVLSGIVHYLRAVNPKQYTITLTNSEYGLKKNSAVKFCNFG
jgi:hypothetical protein